MEGAGGREGRCSRAGKDNRGKGMETGVDIREGLQRDALGQTEGEGKRRQTVRKETSRGYHSEQKEYRAEQ